MRRSLAARTLTLAGVALLLAAVMPAPAAVADPWCGSGTGCGCGTLAPTPCARAVRHVCYDHQSVRRFHTRGQSWSLLRRHLVRLRVRPIHRHPRCYFLPRWPYAGRDVPLGWGGRTCADTGVPATECPLVLAALGEAEEPGEAARRLPPAERLQRAMERFFRGAWEEAEADFEAVAARDEADPRPRWGLALCQVMRRRWPEAVAQLEWLVERGALGRGDHLDLEGSFQDPDAFRRLRRGLVDWTRWRFHESDGQVVAAWTFALTGEVDVARGHVRAALRFAPDHVVARHLEAMLEARRPAPTCPPRRGEEGEIEPVVSTDVARRDD